MTRFRCFQLQRGNEASKAILSSILTSRAAFCSGSSEMTDGQSQKQCLLLCSSGAGQFWTKTQRLRHARRTADRRRMIQAWRCNFETKNHRKCVYADTSASTQPGRSLCLSPLPHLKQFPILDCFSIFTIFSTAPFCRSSSSSSSCPRSVLLLSFPLLAGHSVASARLLLIFPFPPI